MLCNIDALNPYGSPSHARRHGTDGSVVVHRDPERPGDLIASATVAIAIRSMSGVDRELAVGQAGQGAPRAGRDVDEQLLPHHRDDVGR